MSIKQICKFQPNNGKIVFTLPIATNTVEERLEFVCFWISTVLVLISLIRHDKRKFSMIMSFVEMTRSFVTMSFNGLIFCLFALFYLIWFVYWVSTQKSNATDNFFFDIWQKHDDKLRSTCTKLKNVRIKHNFVI